MKRNTIFSNNEVDEILKQYGFVKHEAYVNNRQTLLCSDVDGYRYYISLSNLRYGFKPTRWGMSNEKNLEHNIKLFLKNNNINTAQFQQYTIVHSQHKTCCIVTLKCQCGNNFDIPLTKLVNFKYKNIMCNACKKQLYPSGIKKNQKEYIEKFKSFGYIVENPPSIIKSRTKVDLIDKFGFRGKSCYTSCKQNKHFATFDIGNNKDNFVYNANLLLSSDCVGTKCLGFVDNITLKFQCGCGECFLATYSQFRNKKYRCDKCSKKYSMIEQMVMDYLKVNNINYISQYRIEECCDKIPLPFDFYLPDFNTLIEVDGKQHFYPVFGHEPFEIRQKHDNIKNNYCKNNHIVLIRIPYWDFKNDDWKKHLLQFIEE